MSSFGYIPEIRTAMPQTAYLQGRAMRMAYEGEKQAQQFQQMQMEDFQKQRDFQRANEAAQTLQKQQEFQAEQQKGKAEAAVSVMVGIRDAADPTAAMAAVRMAQGAPPPTDPEEARKLADPKEVLLQTNAALAQLAVTAGVKVPPPKDKATGIIGEYEYAQKQGYTGSFTQYQNEDANRKRTVTNTTIMPGGGRAQIGFEPDPENPGQVRPIKGGARDPEYQAMLTTEKDMTGGVTGRTKIAPLNAVSGHIGQLGPLVDALKNKDVRALNQLKNKMGREFGGIDVTNFDAVAKFVSSELVNALMPGKGTEKDREEFAKTINTAYSTGQIHGVIDQYQGLLATQAQAMMQRWDSAGLDHNRGLQLFSPEVQKRLGGGASSGGGGNHPADIQALIDAAQ
jgi:hypothetical protein